MKGRFIVNPFQELNLTPNDRTQLEDLANSCISASFDLGQKYMASKRRVDLNHWKPLKEREKLKVYSERPEGVAAAIASGDEPTGSGLPMILCVGTMEGKLDDLMFGVISEDLETMRVKASYVDDFSGAAVLDSVVMPTIEDPFQSLVIKWMELDIPFHSTSLVKNRDYVYLEGTGFVQSAVGERFGYHLLHSVNFPQTHQLPGRVRGNLSIIGFWRQVGPNSMEMYATGVMDPVDAGLVRKLVIPNMANVFVSTLKYSYCGQMRKLAFMLDKAYTESKARGAPNKKHVCVTCSAPISGRKLGDFGKSNSTCKLCFGFVCHACKIVRKLSFVDPDLLLSQRKVTFCTACISSVTRLGTVKEHVVHSQAVPEDEQKYELKSLANSLIMSNLEKYTTYQDEKKNGVDPRRWKLCKERQKVKMYVERSGTGNGENITGNGLPLIWGIGTKEGKLDDLMYGLVSPTLEAMRVKASYVDDFSGAAVLDSIVEPSLEEPFQALIIKWMEVDIPFASTNLVKNRDYVYIDATGFIRWRNGERLAYHLMHSVNFPKTPDLPNRIRGNMSAIAFWRQVGSNTMELFGTAVMDPSGDMIKRVAVPSMAGVFICTLKYAYCGQMKKLLFMLDKAYAESKQHGAPNKKNVCVTCSAPIAGRRLGDFGKSNSTCKLCFGHVCHACKIVRKLSFVDPDLLLSQRKVTFCTQCISEATRMSAIDVARAQMLATGKVHNAPSDLQSSISSGGNGVHSDGISSSKMSDF
ncbi:hypothetical protein BBP00_00007847 [Phytophthora kernoviae]|uniref:FYVE-type domain-containing protein n=1 Tax=Phytophthora kernoviae TaxID=325452 RepID=A0A3F2RH12_9STRA|nr:hypothetical protein BBP00_00007847 [Phytophthora kernoviae]